MALTEIEDEQTGDEAKEQNTFGERKTRDRKNRKEKVKPLTKVIIRRLPPSMDEESFLKNIDPLPENDYFYFVPADWSLGQNASSRAYINFINQDDVFIFKEKFDGYVFVDTKGAEYPAIVEFAPFQGLPKGKSRKKDNKSNTVEQDPHFISFMEALNNLDNDSSKTELKMEYSYQIKSDKKITTTPLLEFLANKKQERRDERRRKIEDKKKQRDDDKTRKKDKNSSTSTTFQEEVSRNADDKKRRDRNRKKDVSKTIPSSIPEEDNGDGIVVRTIKSRILERGDRNDRDRGRKDRGVESKQQQAQSKGGGDGREELSGNYTNRSANKDGEPSERDRKRAERNAERKAAIALKEAARRKEKKVRRNERENNRKEDLPEGSIADIDADKADVEAPAEKSKGDGPVVKEERTRKYSESRRERRASRNENRKAENKAATAQTKDAGGSEDNKRESSKDASDPKEIVDIKQITVDDASTNDAALEKVKFQSQTSIDDDEGAKVERRESFDSKQDSSSGGDNSRDTSNAKRDRDMKRIRNKDRPSLQIYQPGRRQPGTNKKDDKSSNESARTVPNSPTEKVMPKSIFDDKKDTGESSLVTNVALQELKTTSEDAGDISVDIKTVQAVKTTEKRVSRYSERRNKIKERFTQRETATVSNDAVEKPSAIDTVESVSTGVGKIQPDTEQSEDATTTTSGVVNVKANENLSKLDVSDVIEKE